MQLEKSSGSFTKLPNKIFELGLDPFEIVAFAALASHGGENAQGIFPSLPRLSELTGMSRRKIWGALNVLAACNVLQWERGKKGVANTYYILPTGAWSRKRGDNSGGSCGKPTVTSAPDALPVVHHRDGSSAPDALPVVHDLHPNQIQLNQTQLTRGAAGFKFGDKSEWTEDRVEQEKRRQLAALASTLRKMP